MKPLMKRGQIQMTETIAVLLIFFVLLLFGVVFYYQYEKSALKEQQQEIVNARTITTIVKTLFLPELICSRGEAEVEDNCLDMMKLRHANETIVRHKVNYYFPLLGYSRITVHILYPAGQTITLYDQPKNSTTGYTPTYLVVTLRDQDQYSFGYVEAGVYS